MANPFEETLQAGRIDPREQAIMQQGMFNQPEEPTYSIGDSYQGDQSGIMNWALTPAKWFHENVGGRINANERYYNPPGGKTTTWRDPNSLFSSSYMGMAIGAALRGKGEPGAEEKWNKIPYATRLAQAGVTHNAPPSSTFSMLPSRYENKLKFNVDIDDLLNKYVPGISVPGDLSASYIHDFDPEDESDVLSLMYSLPTNKLSSMFGKLFGGQ